MNSVAAARDIEPYMLDLVRGDWERAPYGGKTVVVTRWSKLLGIDYSTLYRALPTDRERKGERLIAGIDAAAVIVAEFKFMAPEHRRCKVTEDAIQQAIDNGKIDARFGDVPVATFDRVIRELGLAPKKDRKVRFQALRPNQLHHIDASGSDAFYITAILPNGDYLLKLHKGHRHYKNKPLLDGLGPWLYGVVDDYSGCWTVRYCAARGESSFDNIDFLCWAWSPDCGMDWYGCPERLMGDKGPMIRDNSIREFLKRCGVTIEKTMPGNKDEHGKIEKVWDIIWKRFEATFFTGDWKNFSITMSELNRSLAIFQRAWHRTRKHRFEKKFNRLQMWERINLNGGAALFSTDAIKTIVRAWTRKIDQCGCCTIDGATYEVKGLHLAKVRIYRGRVDDRLVAMDLKDGRKYEVVEFQPQELDDFKGQPKTEHRKIREAAQALTDVQNLLYLQEPAAGKVTAMIATGQGLGATDNLPVSGRASRSKVLKIPVKTSIRDIENPLDLAHYPTIEAALDDFQHITGSYLLDLEVREGIMAEIREHRLSRRFVASLAMEYESWRMAAAM